VHNRSVMAAASQLCLPATALRHYTDGKPWYSLPRRKWTQQPNFLTLYAPFADNIQTRHYAQSVPLYLSTVLRTTSRYVPKQQQSTDLSNAYTDTTQIWHINLLKPTVYVMHQQFNIQQLYALPTLHLCVLYLSENKQRLVPLTA